MAVDGLLLQTITRQLQKYTPCKLGKIQNVSDEEIQFHLHSRDYGNQKLVVNVHSNTNRIYINKLSATTQSTPTNFVMVLRKFLSQGWIESFNQVGFDRIIQTEISSRNEFGDSVKVTLYIELMGKYSNLVLVDEKGIIIDALKRIPVYENSKRFIHPGAIYKLPPQDDKQDPRCAKDLDLTMTLVKQVHGFSPLLSKECMYRLHQGQSFESFIQEIMNSNSLYIYKKEYHCIELKHLDEPFEQFELMDGLNRLYSQDEQKIRIREQCGDVFKTVEKEKRKHIKKLPKLKEALEESMDFEKYKEYGDLLFAYMYEIKKEKTVILPTFETGENVVIPLDMRFDIKDNANKYYQKYHKLKRGQSILQEQIEQCEHDIEYFTQLEEQLQHCSIEDALEIREELIKQRVLLPKKQIQRKKKKQPNFLHLNVNDVDIYVGKNNLQNNYITHHLSRKQDMWFHVKDYHGSHVLIKNPTLDESQIRMCASLAAYFSKGKESSSVPVDYCPISQIKKVPGSKIGFVTMKSYKTIYIDPEQHEIEAWIKEYQVK